MHKEETNEFILSFEYETEIKQYSPALRQIGLDYFLINISFNDGTCFSLTNIFQVLAASSFQKLNYQGIMDSYIAEILASKESYFTTTKAAQTAYLWDKFSEEYEIYPAYYLVRKTPECVFLLSTLQNSRCQGKKLLSVRTQKKFENLCLEIIEKFLPVILQYHPKYKSSLIFTNKWLREMVLKNTYSQNLLSSREKECLLLASTGQSTKQIAKNLEISAFTVESHLKNIRRKLNCSTLVEAVLASVYQGIIGSIT